MANIKISQLPAKGANLAAEDLLEVSEFTGTGYVSKSITGQEIIDAATGSGVTAVTATAPIISTGGTTPNLSMEGANGSDDGFLKSTDWNTFNNKQDALASGVNIKTINSTSLLGSGNVSVQDPITLTTTGTSGAATLVGSTLNIPQYSGGSGGGLKGVHAIVPPTSGDQVLPLLTGTTSATTNSTNRLTLYPFIPSNTIVISNLMINTTTSVAGALARLLIYSDLNGRPNTKLFESTDIDCSFAGIKTFLLSYTFNAGTTYWLGFHVGATSANFVSLSANNTYTFRGNFTAGVNSYFVAASLGAAPAVITSITAQTATIPAIALTIA